MSLGKVELAHHGRSSFFSRAQVPCMLLSVRSTEHRTVMFTRGENLKIVSKP